MKKKKRVTAPSRVRILINNKIVPLLKILKEFMPKFMLHNMNLVLVKSKVEIFYFVLQLLKKLFVMRET